MLAHELARRQRDILITSVAAAVALGITLLASDGMFAAIFGGRRGRDMKAAKSRATWRWRFF